MKPAGSLRRLKATHKALRQGSDKHKSHPVVEVFCKLFRKVPYLGQIALNQCFRPLIIPLPIRRVRCGRLYTLHWIPNSSF